MFLLQGRKFLIILLVTLYVLIQNSNISASYLHNLGDLIPHNIFNSTNFLD